MRIGYFIGTAAEDSDAILRRLAGDLTGRGLAICGVVQVNPRRPGARRCDMVVRALPGGPDIGISQTLGAGARGCRLDAGALEQAVSITEARLARGAELLILNKFGKHEAAGRGFRNAIATALSQNVPVLLKVSPLNLDAFSAFAAGHADLIDPDPRCLTEWALSRIGRTADAP